MILFAFFFFFLNFFLVFTLVNQAVYPLYSLTMWKGQESKADNIVLKDT